jgi:hypothetical protein
MADRNDREQVLFRLRRDDMSRVRRLVRRSGVSLQNFLENLVMREVTEHEARRNPLKNEKTNEEERAPRFAAPASGPAGLGISEHLRGVSTTQPADENILPAQAPVVVNVGNPVPTNGAVGNDIERLAAFVAGGRDFERSMRLRTTTAILHATATSDEERRVLAARLDEAIAHKTKSATDEGGPMKLARVAFDKLKDLL